MKLKKILSFALTVALILSIVYTGISFLPLAAGTESIVYVDAKKGNDINDGMTPEKAFKTIEQAQQILDKKPADKRIIQVIGTAEFNGGAKHENMITITGYDRKAKVKVVRDGKAYLSSKENEVCILKGPTTFENIYLTRTITKDYEFVTDGHEFVIGDDVTGKATDWLTVQTIVGSTKSGSDAVDKLTVNSFPGTVGKNNGGDIRLRHANTKAEKKTSGGLELVINGGVFVCVAFDQIEYNGNANITINGGDFDKTIGESAGLATFNKALQIVLNNGYSEAKLNDSLKNAAAAGGKWIMHSDTSGGTLSTTEKSGKFKVNSELTAKATERKTGAPYYSDKGILTVPEGEYDITYGDFGDVSSNDIALVYVSETGDDSNDGLTQQTAFKTIDHAQKLLSRSTAETKTILVSGVVDFDGGEFHNDMITIRGVDDNAIVNIVRADTLQLGDNIENCCILKGPVTFENIFLNRKIEDNYELLTKGYELVFGKGVRGNSVDWKRVWTIVGSDIENSTTVDKATFHTFPGTSGLWSGGDIRLMNTNANPNGKTSGGLELVINGGVYVCAVFGKVIYNGNVNITMNGGHIDETFGKNANLATFNKALQIVLNNGFRESRIDNTLKNSNAPGGKWLMCGDETNGTLSTTEKEGQFKVNGSLVAKAISRETKFEYYSENGLLTVPAGEYDVTYVDTKPDGYMVNVNHSGTQDRTVGQVVELVKGKTYNFVFDFYEISGKIGENIQVNIEDLSGNTVNSTADNSISLLSEDEIYRRNTYSFTFGGETGSYLVGFNVSGESFVNLANIKLSEGNSEKNLYKNADFELGLDNYTIDDSSAAKGSLSHSVGEGSNKTEITRLSFIQKKFLRPGKEPKVLNIKFEGMYKNVGTNVALEQGKTYKLAFKYKCRKGNFGSTINIGIRNAIGPQYDWSKTYYSTAINSGKETISLVKTGEVYYEMEYGFTTYTPDGMYSLMFLFDSSVDLDIYDIRLYEENDSGVNLIQNGQFIQNIDGWGFEYDFVPEGRDYYRTNLDSNIMELTIKEYVEEDFTIPVGTGEKNMLYVENGSGYTMFDQRVECFPGESYVFEIAVSSLFQYGCYVRHTGARVAIHYNMSPTSMVDKGDYKIYRYEFTLPEETDQEVFVGIQFSSGQNAYLFEPLLYNVKDETKKNIFLNADFSLGLDEWIWGWQKWFRGAEENYGIYLYEEGGDRLEVMPIDYKKFIDYTSDKSVDDGKWWNDGDVEAPAAPTGKLFGTLVNENGKKLAGVQLKAISEEKTYTAKTDSKGNFDFGTVNEGYYEIVTVDNSGAEHSVSFADVTDGSTVSINIICDEPEAVIIETEEPEAEEEEEIIIETFEPDLTSVLKGTVYTPDRKTVAGVKVIMRNGETKVTDSEGNFTFEGLDAGEYELYTLDDEGNEHIFRTVSVAESTVMSVKLKYDIGTNADTSSGDSDSNKNTSNKKPMGDDSNSGFPWWIIIVVGAVVLCGAAATVILIRKRKNDK